MPCRVKSDGTTMYHTVLPYNCTTINDIVDSIVLLAHQYKHITAFAT